VILIIILIENTVWKCCFKRPVSEFFFVFFFSGRRQKWQYKTQQMRLSQVNIFNLTVISNLMYKSKCNKGLTKGSSVVEQCQWQPIKKGGVKNNYFIFLHTNKPWPDSSFILEHTCCRQKCSCFKRTIKGVEEFDFQVIQSKVILTIIY